MQLFADSTEELRRLGPAAIRAVNPVAFVAIDDNYTALRFKRV